MKKIEHIGIAVKSLDESEEIYSKMFGVRPYKREEVASQNVITSFFRVGPSKIELVQATSKDSPIAKFIEKKGEGMHHIAYAVTDIVKELEKLKNEGFSLINETPVPGADNKWVAFLHPKTSGGVLVELCMENTKGE